MKDFNLIIKEFSVHCYEWGKNNKPILVCLHGLGNSGASFLEFAEYLEDHYHILSFDNPGHGRTSPFVNEDDYLFSNLAHWYDNIFKQVLKEPFYLLGHSWGADIALHYAKRYPEKIKGVILLDGGYTFPDFQEDMTFSKVYVFHATLPKDLIYARIAGITELKQNIKDVTIVSMEETNHMVHWDSPQKKANEIHNWVTKQLLN
ncbi:alpha/beta fold hydrolase [Neobacillus mesonae]|uniref:alpha/beta fold hydrolase n=1 Tax=Neobacillus mesonae TaxID=1193713 RepID=UPI002E1B86CE|nr:alpha/beta fold hydrolase [Neobacillus mesonae]